MASENAKVAAIAGQAARERYGLKAFQEHIQDDAHNTTRFLVLGNQITGSLRARQNQLGGIRAQSTRGGLQNAGALQR